MSITTKYVIKITPSSNGFWSFFDHEVHNGMETKLGLIGSSLRSFDDMNNFYSEINKLFDDDEEKSIKEAGLTEEKINDMADIDVYNAKRKILLSDGSYIKTLPIKKIKRYSDYTDSELNFIDDIKFGGVVIFIRETSDKKTNIEFVKLNKEHIKNININLTFNIYTDVEKTKKVEQLLDKYLENNKQKIQKNEHVVMKNLQTIVDKQKTPIKKNAYAEYYYCNPLIIYLYIMFLYVWINHI